MDFVGSNAWFGALITLHVLGAVIGLGPTFAFGLMGPLAGKLGGPQGLGILEAMHNIEYKMVTPILMTVQPITGALLIWNRGLNNDFFSSGRLWLIGGIVAYTLAFTIALGIQGPAIKQMIGLAKSGRAESPEFGALAAKTSKFGPVLGILGLVILVLMIWKPGSGCTYQC